MLKSFILPTLVGSVLFSSVAIHQVFAQDSVEKFSCEQIKASEKDPLLAQKLNILLQKEQKEELEIDTEYKKLIQAGDAAGAMDHIMKKMQEKLSRIAAKCEDTRGSWLKDITVREAALSVMQELSTGTVVQAGTKIQGPANIQAKVELGLGVNRQSTETSRLPVFTLELKRPGKSYVTPIKDHEKLDDEGQATENFYGRVHDRLGIYRKEALYPFNVQAARMLSIPLSDEVTVDVGASGGIRGSKSASVDAVAYLTPEILAKVKECKNIDEKQNHKLCLMLAFGGHLGLAGGIGSGGLAGPIQAGYNIDAGLKYQMKIENNPYIKGFNVGPEMNLVTIGGLDGSASQGMAGAGAAVMFK